MIHCRIGETASRTPVVERKLEIPSAARRRNLVFFICNAVHIIAQHMQTYREGDSGTIWTDSCN